MKEKMNKNKSLPLLMMLGIEKNCALFLLALIEDGPSRVSALSKKLLLSRTTSYEYIGVLLKKDLICRASRGLAYQAINTSALTTKIKQALHESEESLLNSINNGYSRNEKPKIRINDDTGAIRAVYEDIGFSLPQGGTYYRYTSRKEDDKRSEVYRELRIKKEIERLVITSAEKAGQKLKDSNRFIKTIPKEFTFDDNISLIIYGDKIAHLDHKTGTAITIISKSIARFQEKIFKILWRKL